MPYQTEALAILKAFRTKLFLQESKEFFLLAKQWGVVESELMVLIEKIAAKEVKSEDQLFRLALYQQFLDESRSQIQDYSKIAGGVISKNQKAFGVAGIEQTQQMIELKVSFFNRLNVEAISNMIGKSYYDGSLLDKTLFLGSYNAYTDQIKARLVQGIALGHGPRETARLIKNDAKAPLWQSLRLARTEQLNIYRQTSTMQMIESGVVSQKERYESGDACPECAEVNGNKYALDDDSAEDFHPNCRGCWLPVI